MHASNASVTNSGNEHDVIFGGGFNVHVNQLMLGQQKAPPAMTTLLLVKMLVEAPG